MGGLTFEEEIEVLIKDQDQIHGLSEYGKVMCQFCGGKEDSVRNPADIEIWLGETPNLLLCADHALVVARLLLVDLQDMGPYRRHAEEIRDSSL